MTRSDFVKRCTAACSCAGLALLPPDRSPAQPAAPSAEDLQRRLDAVQKRFAALVQILNDTLDEPTRQRVWESLGRDHGREYQPLADKYKGNLAGFLAEIRRQWVASVDYDAAAGTITITDKSPACTCPLVREGLTPGQFCDCTLGWQKEVYSAIVGRPVDVTLQESILRGGKRCVFRIQIV
jgi:predicted hydrocarbon binding protein